MITILGSINLDLIARVERLPRPGETVPGEAFSTAPGGKGANQALAARRAGAPVRMVGAVGQDAFAGQALALLEKAGVELAAVAKTGTATGTAMILVGGDGENMIAIVPGANAEVLPEHVERAAFGAREVVLLQHEVPLQTVKAALGAARAAGAVSILNTAPFHAAAADFVAVADYVIANETEFDLYAEALALAGADREARIRAFARQTGRTMIVTLGKDGAVAATPEDFLRVPAHPVTPVDTVGAGDTFCGYFAAALVEGVGLKEALGRAAVAGALACLKPGAQPAIPLRAEIDAAMGSP
ncbi:ribokinase [Chelativorans sp. M5D2P16]|uniref:ribokinase n=1 Tax=Chelativorans sp. M5D2P16 TaxID=3095678 RepID=UPI002ACAF72C|nr:ribokinase [Chelativorans sp. M5D2P16]MDZ5697208.1 ribokinase [Chelativorans sp. M5D2P16]